jgi:hypothetical protein
MWVSSFLFWDVTRCWFVVGYRHFGTTCQSHFQGFSAWHCKMGSSLFWNKSNYQLTLHNIVEQRRSQKDTSLHRCLWSYSNLPMHADVAGVRSMYKRHDSHLPILTVMFQSHCFKNKIFYLSACIKNICMKYYYVTFLSVARGNCHSENSPVETGIQCILLVSVLFPKQNRWLPHNV